MPYDSNLKKLYVDTANKRGIALKEIAACLQDYRVNTRGKRDKGMLCTSPNINKWSKNKPFVVANGTNLRKAQTDEARRLAAYGFYWWNYILENEAPFADNPTTLLNKAIANEGNWAYKRPTEIFRARDFDGYRHAAVAPYRYDINSPDLGQNNYCKPTTDPYDPDVDIRVSDMPDFLGEYSGSTADLNVAIIHRIKGSTGAPVVTYTGYTVAQMDTNSIEATKINMGALGNAVRKSYDVIFAATSTSSADEDGVWLYLPDSLRQIDFKAGLTWAWEPMNVGGEIFNGMVMLDANDNILSAATDEVRYVDFSFAIRNQFPYALDWQMQILMWDAASETIDDAQTILRTDSTEWGTIPKDNGYLIFSDAGNPVRLDVTDVNGDHRMRNIKIAVNFQYKYTVNTGYISRHLDFSAGTFVNYEASDGFTLYELAQNYIPDYGKPI